jgi:pimeloyl-ACP methyl ester carboxylesterase
MIKVDKVFASIQQLTFKLILIGFTFMGSNQAAFAEQFVLVHGSWHGAWNWYKLEALLERDGHDVIVVDLPAHGIDRSPAESVQLQDYTNTVTDVLDGLSDKAILVGHSMGGIVISSAAEARPEKIEKLVYLAAFLVPNGSSLLDFAFQDVDSLVGQNLIPVDLTNDGIPDALDINRSVIKAAFYGESRAHDVALAESLLVVDPIAPVGTPLSLGGNFESVPRFYISTSLDKAVTPAIQEVMYTLTPVEKVYTLNSDHSAFFSRPKKLRNILNHIIHR